MNPFAPPDQGPIPGSEYIAQLHTHLRSSLPRLAPPARAPSGSLLAQSYTLLTLGLDPSSASLSPALKVPLTLGFGRPSPPSSPARASPSPPARARPQLLRLAPDKLLYLLLRWQSLPQALPHVGDTDEPVPPGVSTAARPGPGKGRARGAGFGGGGAGDAGSVRSWVPSMRSVSSSVRAGWFGREEVSEEKLLLEIYSMFTVLPGLLIHPPCIDDRPIAELVDAGGYTQLGGLDVRVPLAVFRNLQILELEYDPRALCIPPSDLRELHVRGVPDGDDWLPSLLLADDGRGARAPEASTAPPPAPLPRFPRLTHLALTDCALLALAPLPLPALRSLDLSANLLDAVPPALAAVPTLEALSLAGNVLASVRGAPAALGNVAALNLAGNRLDCLVGLERVRGLQRVDVRRNRLADVGELGRLAELPVLRELWAAGGGASGAGGGGEGGDGGGGGGNTAALAPDYRVELGALFAATRGFGGGGADPELVLDGAPFGWAETRQIEALLAARGLARRRSANLPAVPAAGTVSAPPTLSRASAPAPADRPAAAARPDAARAPGATTPSGSASPAMPSSPARDQRKRRKRRVVDLGAPGTADGSVGAGTV